VQTHSPVSGRSRLAASARRLARPITAGLEEKVAELAAEIAELRQTVGSLPASEATMTSAIEASLVLSRSARVLESLTVALAPPQAGEVVFNVRNNDVATVEAALREWHIVARDSLGDVTVLRGRFP
jgi:hypothetical protein